MLLKLEIADWLDVSSPDTLLAGLKEGEAAAVVAEKPSGSVRYPIIPVMSENAVLLRTTARKDGPSPGPTSLSEGSVDPAVSVALDKLPTSADDVATLLSTQYASMNPLLIKAFCCEDDPTCCPVLA